VRPSWWVANDFEGSQFLYALENDVPDSSERAGNWEGPFKSLAEAKQCGLEYHRATVLTAHNAIAEIKLARARDLKVDAK
jgi:hypothetical protein